MSLFIPPLALPTPLTASYFHHRPLPVLPFPCPPPALSRMTSFLAVLFVCALLFVPAAVSGQSATVVGAAYTMSNLPSGNTVIVSAVAAAGDVTYAATVPTGGLGAAVLTGGVSTLGNLFSQDSLVVDQTRGLLFAVNAGSDSVSMFTIDARQPTQTTLVATQPTGFGFPVSIALSTNRSLACVLNGGANNGIRCFSYSASALTVIASFDRSLGLANIVLAQPSSPFNTTGDIIFTSDSLALAITVRSDGSNSGSLYVFLIDYATNTLAAAPIVSSLGSSQLPFSLSLVGSSALLVTEPLLGSVAVVSYNSTDGTTDADSVTPFAIPVTTGFGALCWSRYSPTTGNYLLIGTGVNGTIIEVSVNQQTLQTAYVGLATTQPLAEALDTSVATIGGQDFLYVIGPAAQIIQVFSLSGGGISPVGTAPLPGATISMVGLAVYTVASPAGGSVLGDPQFVGLLGQSYQVHGIDGQVYSVIHDSTVRVNARFTFLSSGKCPTSASSSSGCWSHSGSYLGSIAVVANNSDALVIVSGSAETGFSTVSLGSTTLSPSADVIQSGALSVHFTDRFTVSVSVGNFELTIENSDWFVNLARVAVHHWAELKTAQCHGLLGQTWDRRRARGEEVHEVEGRVDDYAELDNDLLGDRFAFLQQRQQHA